MSEKRTDYYVKELLDSAGIEAVPEGSSIKGIQEALKKASKSQTGETGFPEFTAVVGDFVIVIENKQDVNKHVNLDENKKIKLDISSTKGYAVNGAVWYAKKIVEGSSFKKVFAIGCSGDKHYNEITPVYVSENQIFILENINDFEELNKTNISSFYEKEINGNQKNIEEQKSLIESSKELHEYLRDYGQLADTEKAIVVSAILLALEDDTIDDLVKSLKGKDKSEGSDGKLIHDALKRHLQTVDVKPEDKKRIILNQFNIVKDRTLLNQKNESLEMTPLRFFTEFIQENILPLSKDVNSHDILGQFFGEFVRYGGGDKQELGIVLTPKHITDLCVDLLNIQKEDVVFDPCCGTGSFLISAMKKMINDSTTDEEKNNIKKNQIHGIEIREDMFTIATTNMILRGDGKSNLLNEDFFSIKKEEILEKKYTKGLMNPPFSQGKKGKENLSELEFIKHLLNSLTPHSKSAIITPLSTMTGGNKKHSKKIKKEIFENHSLDGVITLNRDTFGDVGTEVCIALFTSYEKHNPHKNCKFIDFRDDGFEFTKQHGLIETESAKEKKEKLIGCWVHDEDAEDKFMIKTHVKADDEWLHAFYYFDDSVPDEHEFSETMADYLSFEYGMKMENKSYLFDSD